MTSFYILLCIAQSTVLGYDWRSFVLTHRRIRDEMIARQDYIDTRTAKNLNLMFNVLYMVIIILPVLLLISRAHFTTTHLNIWTLRILQVPLFLRLLLLQVLQVIIYFT